MVSKLTADTHLTSPQKFSELIYLYNGKKMHGKALDLLKQSVDLSNSPARDGLIP